MSRYSLTYKPFGDSAILIEWPKMMDDSILEDVIVYYNKIQSECPVYIKEVVQSINSLTVIYDSQLIPFDRLVMWLKELENKTKKLSELPRSEIWKIPVCYDLQFGIDLKEMSAKNALSISRIIELHTQSTYRVYSIGFLPGFLYLGGLDERLFIDRKSTPRLEVPQGAVGIGGKQTGIYPSASPGGWNIIGNSPISFFDVTQAIPCFAKPGDRLQFYAVSAKDYEDIRNRVENNSFVLEKEVMSD